MTTRMPIRAAVPVLLLTLAVLLAYWPGLSGGFAFDDFPNIVNNARLIGQKHTWSDWVAAAFSSPASELQRPLAMFTFAANSFFTGLDPWPMKFTNLAIHVINSLLVFALVRRILHWVAAGDRPGNAWLAFMAAAFWALSPINLTAVLYVVQRMESLSHFFVFLGLLLYCTGRARQLARRPGGWGLVATALGPCTALGILVKESAALLPLYCFLLEVTVLRFQGPAATSRLLKVAYACVLLVPALVAVAWLLPRSLEPGAYAARDFTLLERMMSEPRAIVTYLRWIALPNPSQMSLFQDEFVVSRSLLSPPTTLPAILFIAAAVAAGWWLRNRRPLASLGIAWFFAAHAITGTFLPLELVFEHRNYFASAGVALVFVDTLRALLESEKRRGLAWLVAGACLAVIAGLTHIRALEWSSPLKLSASEAAKHPRSPRATYDLGRTLVIMGDYDPHSPFTVRAMSVLESSRLMPDSGVLPEHALLLTASRAGLPVDDQWWDGLSAKLKDKPAGPQEIAAIQALTRCAVERACRFSSDHMLGMFGAALSRETHPEVLNTFGDYALNVLGDRELALELWTEASRIAPREVQYQANRVLLLIAIGRFDDARSGIGRIKTLGRVGQNVPLAESLTRRLEKAQRGDGAGE